MADLAKAEKAVVRAAMAEYRTGCANTHATLDLQTACSRLEDARVANRARNGKEKRRG